MANAMVQPLGGTVPEAPTTVFSTQRDIEAPTLALPTELKTNSRLKMDGVQFLSKLPINSFPVCFFDPQYRGVLDKLSYGNEGVGRGKGRCALEQMDDAKIIQFIRGIDRVLMASGHLFLWLDKFHLCQGFKEWLTETSLEVVDMIVWDKQRIGMGYRSRRVSEYLIVLQKLPKKAKGVWKIHNIPDVWQEKVARGEHPHIKPLKLQAELIASVSNEGDIILDPAAGSFSVKDSATLCKRNFLGCDLNG